MGQSTYTWSERMMCSLFKYVPARVKRVIVIASVFAKVKDERDFDHSTLLKLNNIMKLHSSPDALQLPIMLSNVIYRKSSKEIFSVNMLKPHLSAAQIQEAVNGLKAYTPEWLLYNEEANLEEDLTRLFSNRELVLGS